jgi:hypothetical protein
MYLGFRIEALIQVSCSNSLGRCILNDVITLGDNEFLMVYGVNHVATLKATYQNITVYATGREVHGKLVGKANA